nr:hypothetical protein StreXyl84_67730 [Streptomyces sp. Xyl84]
MNPALNSVPEPRSQLRPSTPTLKSLAPPGKKHAMFLSRHGPGRSGPERAHPHVPDGAAVLPHVRRAPERRAGHVPAAVHLPLSRPPAELTALIDSSGAGAPDIPRGTSAWTGTGAGAGAGAGPAVAGGSGHSGCTA